MRMLRMLRIKTSCIIKRNVVHIWLYMNQKNYFFACDQHHTVKHVTNSYADGIDPDPVLGIGSLVVEETDSISVFIEKK